METVFWFMTPPQFKDIGYLVNFRAIHKPLVAAPGFGFNEIDPLLGYSKTPATLKAQGFNLAGSGIILTTTDDTAGCINILLTGGSTSDLSLYADNWPLELRDILKQHGIKARLYCDGVGGYNSGQELLKLIRDGLDTRPWIHLSYSGANEFIDPSYVSVFEENFYGTELDINNARTSWLLPNTVMFMRDLFRMNHESTRLFPNRQEPHAAFWTKNMRLMHGVAVENNYRFIALLQPVLGSSKFNQSVVGHEESIAQYKREYHVLRDSASRYPGFMVDLSAIFDTCKGPVFMDNCHINDPYQHVVAENIFGVLKEKAGLGN